MFSILEVVLLVVILLLFALVLLFSDRIDNLMTKLSKTHKRIRDLEEENSIYRWKYLNEISDITSEEDLHNTIYKLVVEARKMAHPDNGGSASSFTKYNAIYDILVRKKL